MEKKAKIGIMTWYQYENYGSVLQAYALAHKISELGYLPEFINYKSPKPGKEKQDYTLKNYIYLSKKIIRGLRILHSTSRKSKFANFVDTNLVQTEEISSYSELFGLNNLYEAFLCGSDQIWAPSCFDEKYFLSFVDNTQKMIAYAPSLGLTKIENPVVEKQMGELIKRFDKLSVREDQGKELLQRKWGIDSEVVLDPTLLLDSDAWDKILSKDSNNLNINEDYILCYFLGDYNRYKRYVQKIANKKNMKIIVVPMFVGQIKDRKVECIEAAPLQFVQLIKHAKLVCTDSFHGTAFSINYNVPFVTFERFKKTDKNNQNSRIYNLLRLSKLDTRIASDSKDIEELFSIDFTDANNILKRERIKSLEYLEKSLKNAVVGNGNLNERASETKNITRFCCGCGACASICPKDAIQIELNSKGFFHYSVDNEKCINCGLCEKVCPLNSLNTFRIQNANGLFALKSKHENVLKISSSGGIGYEIANYLQDKGYFICGCSYNRTNNAAEHIIIAPEDKAGLRKIQGSKYIQSNSGVAIEKLMNLDNNEKAAFFGTPCQVAGVDKILRLKGKRSNFVLVDLICHGVPTSFLWEKYLSEMNRRIFNKNESPLEVSFRDKSGSWQSLMMSIKSGTYVYKRNQYRDIFYSFFRSGHCFMESCFECPYRTKSSADIRIGDYWGQRFRLDKQGVSMVIAMNEQGLKVLEELCENAVENLGKFSLDEYWKVQYPVNHKRPIYYDTLIEQLKDPGISLKMLRRKYYSQKEFVERLGQLYKKMMYVIKVKNER